LLTNSVRSIDYESGRKTRNPSTGKTRAMRWEDLGGQSLKRINPKEDWLQLDDWTDEEELPPMCFAPGLGGKPMKIDPKWLEIED